MTAEFNKYLSGIKGYTLKFITPLNFEKPHQFFSVIHQR
jgi:hypothetical protein